MKWSTNKVFHLHFSSSFFLKNLPNIVKKVWVALPWLANMGVFIYVKRKEKKRREDTRRGRKRGLYFHNYRLKKEGQKVLIRFVNHSWKASMFETMLRSLEEKLDEVVLNSYYRFPCEWSFQMGWTANRTTSMKGFETLIPF